MVKALFPLLLLVIVVGCKSSLTWQYATADHVQWLQPDAPKRPAPSCNDPMAYIPDTMRPNDIPMRYVRVNIHYLNNTDGTANFPEQEGRQFARDMVDAANRTLRELQPMNLPIGNETPVVPAQFQYVLWPDPAIPGDDGIYFHYEDSLYFNDHTNMRYVFNSYPYDRYGIQKEEVVNVFLIPHHPDSLRSSTYPKVTGGVGTNHWAKLTGVYHQSKQPAGYLADGRPYTFGAWFAAMLFNHEVGHVLGLPHSWNQNDGCDDTPRHTNCWNYAETGPCSEAVSNNIMDYNTYRNALTPCQIGKIQANFARRGSTQRQKLVQDWCASMASDEMDVVISRGDSVVWQGNRDLRGNIIVETGGVLTIHCAVSLPAGCEVRVEPGGKLIIDGGRIHQACNEEWLGIRLGTRKKKSAALMMTTDAAVVQAANPVEWPDTPTRRQVSP